MKPNTRLWFIWAHVVLAGFFLPAAVMFSITGGLYTFSITGKYNTSAQPVSLVFTEEPTVSEAQEASKSYLLSSGKSSMPTGKASIKKMGTSWSFEWTGADYDFILEPTEEAGVYKASIKDTTWHRYFVQLHKAKGGFPFKVLAGGLAVAFLLMFVSGVALAATLPRMRKPLYMSVALGFIAFFGLAFLS